MSFAEIPIAEQGKQQYKYNGKEFDVMHGLNLYDYSARQMNATLPGFTTIDPHAENYYAWSPYSYVGNNPLIRTDPTGMDWYYFDGNSGKYKNKTEMDGEHRMVVSSTDKKGNITYKFYDFNDPKSDSQSIENGEITGFQVLSDGDVGGIMDKSGVKDQNIFSRWEYAIRESNANNIDGNGKMDFRIYPELANTDHFYLMKGYAYNASDAGNYLWGFAMRIMGFSESAARSAAHANAWYSAKESNGEGSQNPSRVKRWFENRSWLGDSKEDQQAIKRGMQNSGSYWKYKIKSIKKLW